MNSQNRSGILSKSMGDFNAFRQSPVGIFPERWTSNGTGWGVLTIITSIGLYDSFKSFL
jgi:hypothetical protein